MQENKMGQTKRNSSCLFLFYCLHTTTPVLYCSWSRVWKCCSYWGWTELSSIRLAAALKYSTYWTTTHAKVEYDGGGIFFLCVWLCCFSSQHLQLQQFVFHTFPFNVIVWTVWAEQPNGALHRLPSFIPQEELEEVPGCLGPKYTELSRSMSAVCFLNRLDLKVIPD